MVTCINYCTSKCNHVFHVYFCLPHSFFRYYWRFLVEGNMGTEFQDIKAVTLAQVTQNTNTSSFICFNLVPYIDPLTSKIKSTSFGISSMSKGAKHVRNSHQRPQINSWDLRPGPSIWASILMIFAWFFFKYNFC